MQSVQTPIFSICPPCNGYGVTPESMLTGLSFLELSELETECPECFGYGLIKQSDRGKAMRILEKDIQNTINGIVGFFRRAAMSAETVRYHEILQARHLDQLQGIRLVLPHSINLDNQLNEARHQILQTIFFSSDGLCRSSAQPSDDLGQEITNG